MENIITKIIICSGSLLGLYYLFLAKEKTFVFNRFYLIFSLIFSMCIPFFTIETIPIENEKPEIIFEQAISQQVITNNIEKQQIWDFSTIIVSIYSLAAFIFLIKFVYSLIKIKNLKGKNILHNKRKIVLLQKDHAPFSFWNTIYVSEKHFINNEIGNQIFLHEEIPIRQKHTIDLLFAEILKIVLWFNPFIYLYKKVIISNHEFLADEGVIKQNKNIKTYQELILNEILKQQNPALVHSFNFNNTKKRFIMMTKQNSKFGKAKRFMAIPVFAIATFAFAEKVYGSENVISAKKQQSFTFQDSPYVEYQKILQKYSQYLDKKDYPGFLSALTPQDKNSLYELYLRIPEEQTYDLEVVVKESKGKFNRKKITDEVIKKYLDAQKYIMIIDGKKVENSKLSTYNKADFATFVEMNSNPKDGLKQNRSVIFMTNKYHENYLKKKLITTMIRFNGNSNSSVINDTIIQKTIKALAKEVKSSASKEKTVTDVAVATAFSDQEKTPAEFPGGMDNFRRSIGENFNHLPFESKGGTVSASVMISIDENGNTTDVKANGDNVTFNNEAIRTVKIVTNNKVWKPATENGKAVKSVFKLPLKMAFADKTPAK